MLELISLHAIQEIFDSTGVEISSVSKTFYINCLMHHFKGKKATVVNAMAFEFTNEDIDFVKFKKQISELHKAALVVLNGDILAFNNSWGKYIDRSKLDKDEKQSYTGSSYNFIPMKDLLDGLLKNESLLELCRMRNKIEESQVILLIKDFAKEQISVKKTYLNEQECAKHCINWIGKASKSNPGISSTRKRAALD